MKKLKCILSSVIGASMVEILILMGTTSYWHILRQGVAETHWCSVMKIKSNGNPDLLMQLIIKTDKNTNRNKSCGKLSAMIETIVDKNIEKSYDSDKHPVPGKPTKVHWNSKQGTEVTIKALLEEGAIYIQQPGYYYVASMLTLRAENGTSTGTAKHTSDVMSHVVNVLHHKDETGSILLENVKSPCELAVGHADWSSNIGAAFYLNEHDKVYVATSHPYNIVNGHSSNYLNIHTML